MLPDNRTVDPAAREMLERAEALESSTAWDRHEALQPQCGFGELGLCCHICYMGPCRIDPFGEGPREGICGADADLIVARNMARAVAAGAAAHSDHGREVAEVFRLACEKGPASGYAVTDPGRMRQVAADWGIETANRDDGEVAGELANAFKAQFGVQDAPPAPLMRAPEGQRERWEKAGILPRGIDREIVELLHRTHHGVESDPVALLRAAFRAALADGWGGSMIATDGSDILFGEPEAIRSRVNLGVLEEDRINILVHGHEPVLSEWLVRASREEEILSLAAEAGSDGINIAGICCTANEILMRQGMPVAGNYLHQELALLTGAVDLMVVDVQCVLPSLPRVASCFHTRVVTTSHIAHIPAAERLEFDPANPRETAREILKLAIEAYPRRDRSNVQIPRESMDLVAGFTAGNMPYYLGGRFRSGYRPLNDAVAAGRIRGVAGVVGCNTTRVTQDANHLALVRHLLARDVLVVQTGCSAIASAKAGLLRPEAALEAAGPGLREVCEAAGIPPVLHLGSCVDNSRILTACAAIAAEGGIGEDLSELPVAAAAPEAMSEKAITIGCYAVASGVFTVFMPVPRLAGSSAVRRYLENDVESELGGKFLFTDDARAGAEAIIDRLDEKRKALKLAPMMFDETERAVAAAVPRTLATYIQPKGLESLGCGEKQRKSQAGEPEN